MEAASERNVKRDERQRRKDGDDTWQRRDSARMRAGEREDSCVSSMNTLGLIFVFRECREKTQIVTWALLNRKASKCRATVGRFFAEN